jgi:hypothetical protein
MKRESTEEKIAFEKFKRDIAASGLLSKIEIDRIVSKKHSVSHKKNLMRKLVEFKGFNF